MKRPHIFEIVDDATQSLDPKNPIASARRLVRARFVDGDDCRLLHHHRGSFWKLAGNYYAPAAIETVRASACQFLESAKQVTKKGSGPFKPTSGRVSNVLDALAAVCNLDSLIDPPAWLGDPGDLPPACEMLAVANGLLHLPTGELYPATPHHFGLSASEVMFDPDAAEPAHWLAFLKDLFGADTESIQTLQDWCGYALAPDTSQQKILLIVGPRRSGKGTIARVLREILGHASVAGPTLASLQMNFGLWPLIGKPLAIISDARLGGKSDQAMIAERLLSISGEDTITIDRKHMSAWTGRLPTRFVILTNELPRIADSSGALAGRFIVLVLENSFYGREDTGLGNRLLGELPGILNWALVGYRRIRERGHFVQPRSSSEAIEELEALGSPIKAFIRDSRYCVGPQYSVAVELIYQDWRTWAQNNGRRDPGTKQSFGRDLRAAISGLRTSQHSQDGSRSREYRGIGMKGESDETQSKSEDFF
jgi:putative DNA primase/helicase